MPIINTNILALQASYKKEEYDGYDSNANTLERLKTGNRVISGNILDNSLNVSLSDTLTDNVLVDVKPENKLNIKPNQLSLNKQKFLLNENTSLSVYANELSSIQVYKSKIRGIDYLTLYSLKSEQFIDFETNSLIYGTPLLSASFNYVYDLNNNCYQYKNDFYDNNVIDEVNIDKYTGIFNNIYTDLSYIKPNTFYCINNIIDVSLNYIKGDFKTLEMLDDGYINTINGVDVISQNILKYLTTFYYRGGYNFYNGVMRKLSYSNIFKMVNSNSKYIFYVTVDNDKVLNDEISVSFVQPDVIYKNEMVTSTINSNESVLSKKSFNYKINRYSGEYEPKFNNIINFKIKDSITVDSVNYDLNLSNTSFNTNLDDFGIVKNLYYNKISDIDVLDNNSNVNSMHLYSKVDDIGIDKRDFYVFKSNWDNDYYRKYIDKKYYASLIGSRSMYENKSFLGSKLMKIPKNMVIDNFKTLKVNEGDIIDDIDINNESFYYVKNNEIVFNVYFNNLIVNFFLNNGIKKVFHDNLIFEFMGLDKTSFNDNIIEYIKINLLNKYYISDVFLYEKTSLNNDINIVTELKDVDKIIEGFNITKSFKFNIIDGVIKIIIPLSITNVKDYSFSLFFQRV